MAHVKLSKAYNKYGASMGRASYHADERDVAAKFRLHAIPLDGGGYDNGGAYWGWPSDLYRAIAESDAGEIELFIRAPSREQARAIVVAKYPNARFYR